MENRINVAELLKNCPKGMELDCTIYEGAKLDCVTKDKNYPIRIIIKDDINGNIEIYLTKEGYYNVYHNPKCVIFPKGKTTWEGFVPPSNFKDGDVVAFDNELGKVELFIFKEYVTNITAICYLFLDGNTGLHINKSTYMINRLATKEEKGKLFKALKDKGYKWNEESKTLEKLVKPKFKVGDRIKKDKDYISGIITNISDDGSYKVEYQGGGVSYVSLAYQNEWELVPNKFDISTLVPFESKVLVRAVDNQFWRPAIWGVKHRDWDFCCVLGGEIWEQCIPYEGNEHLSGNTDDCDEYYKTWD